TLRTAATFNGTVAAAPLLPRLLHRFEVDRADFLDAATLVADLEVVDAHLHLVRLLRTEADASRPFQLRTRLLDRDQPGVLDRRPHDDLLRPRQLPPVQRPERETLDRLAEIRRVVVQRFLHRRARVRLHRAGRA